MRKDFTLQSLVFACGRFDGQEFRFFDEGADNKSLVAFRDLLGNEGVGLTAARSCAPARDNLLAPRGELVDNRYIQISIKRQGQRSWDRGCGHHQHMRMVALLAQGVALLHAKAMLFIDDHQP